VIRSLLSNSSNTTSMVTGDRLARAIGRDGPGDAARSIGERRANSSFLFSSPVYTLLLIAKWSYKDVPHRHAQCACRSTRGSHQPCRVSKNRGQGASRPVGESTPSQGAGLRTNQYENRAPNPADISTRPAQAEALMRPTLGGSHLVRGPHAQLRESRPAKNPQRTCALGNAATRSSRKVATRRVIGSPNEALSRSTG